MYVNNVQVIVIYAILTNFVLILVFMILIDIKDNLVHVNKSFIFIKIFVNYVEPSALNVNIPQVIVLIVINLENYIKIKTNNKEDANAGKDIILYSNKSVKYVNTFVYKIVHKNL